MNAGSPISVLHVIEDLGLGGAERLLGTLLPELRERGIAAEVAALGSRTEAVAPLETAGILVHQRGLRSYKQAAAATTWLYGLIRGQRYDIVHTHLAFANLYGRLAGRLAGVPVATTYHDSDYEPEVLLARPEMASWKQETFRLLDRTTSRLACRAVAVSEYVAVSIQRRLSYPRDRVEVIYNGVPPSAWTNITEETRAARRRELGIDPAARVVVQVGRLSPQKGQLDALRVAERLRQVAGLRFLLVGDGPLRPDLERVIADRGLDRNVTLFGGRPDVASFLAASDVFLFPSLHEGLGIAALEAMAAGLPVVAYRTGPLPEVVEDGVTGTLVEPGDISGLEVALATLLDDAERRRTWGRRGRDRVVSRFSIAQTADRHATLYARVLEGRRRQ